MSLPKIVYEAAPAVYAIVGVATATGMTNTLGRVCGGMLVAAALTILHMRSTYRGRGEK